jgi:predicted histidine transporter YuiF (NhaC family)
MDLTTSVTILSGLATFLGFVWSIFHSYQKKKDESDSEDDECQDKEESIEKLGHRVEELEKTVGTYAVELEKLTELAAIAKEENARIRQDFLDNLDRIENRLEKMIDLILRLKQDD